MNKNKLCNSCNRELTYMEMAGNDICSYCYDEKRKEEDDDNRLDRSV